MANVLDVAQHILDEKQKPLSALKLQKIVYYCQAWSLVWDDKPLFPEEIEAWANGPVIRALYEAHKGSYEVYDVNGNPNVLIEIEKETIDAVWRDYGGKSAQWLVMLSHSELPWRAAREGLEPFEPSRRVIQLDDIANYYSGLLSEVDAETL
jgi:uncharacterized phage-associated protein